MSEEKDSASFKFPLLNGNNYATWKFKMQMVLKDKALWKFATGEARQPTGANETEQSRHEQRADKALATICLGVDDNQQVYVENAATAKEAWDNLKNQYEKSTLSNKLFLRRRFLNLSMSETDAMSDHISKLRSLATQLATIGAPVSDDDLVTTMLCSLPPSYDSLITALESRDPKDLTVQFVTGRLLHEADKRANKSNIPTDNESSQQAIVARTKQYSKKLSKCGYCKKFGHRLEECFKKKRSDEKRKSESQIHSSEVKDSQSQSDEAEVVYEVFLSTAEQKDQEWIIDSAATRHMTGHRKWFSTYETLPEGKVRVKLGDGSSLKVEGQGNVRLELADGKPAVLTDVLHVPRLSKNLFSVKAAAKTGAETQFTETGCEIKRQGKVVARGSSQNGLYWLACVTVFAIACFSGACIKPATAQTWHKRLGHINFQDLQRVQSMTTGMEVKSSKDPPFCHGCHVGKMAKQPFPKKADLQSHRDIGEIIHSDISGPMPVESQNGKRYFISFIDEASHMVAVHFPRDKSEALNSFKQFVALVANQVGKRVKRLRSDKGSQNTSIAFIEFCNQEEIIQEKSAPYTPQQNGLAERMNRTLDEAARSILLDVELPEKYWASAAAIATHIRNRCPTSALSDMTPSMAFIGKKPDISYFKTFGCRAYVKVPDAQRREWDPKSVLCRFLGYEGAAYKLVNMKTGRNYISREIRFISKDEDSSEKKDAEIEATEASQKELRIFQGTTQSLKAGEWLKAAQADFDSPQERGAFELIQFSQSSTESTLADDFIKPLETPHFNKPAFKVVGIRGE